MKILFDKHRCTACGLCELACSFHHSKSFLPDKASIVICMDRKGHIEIKTLPTCDFCKNEDMPMCVEFCPTGAIKGNATETPHKKRHTRNATQLDNLFK
jgi:Fe-S-cluster-containing dehydrogenase component